MNTIMKINAMGNVLAAISEISTANLPHNIIKGLSQVSDDLMREMDDLPRTIDLLSIDKLSHNGKCLIEYLNYESPKTPPGIFFQEYALVNRLNYLGSVLRQVIEQDECPPLLRRILEEEESKPKPVVADYIKKQLNDDGLLYIEQIGV